MSHEGAERATYVRESKTVIHRYLEPPAAGRTTEGASRDIHTP